MLQDFIIFFCSIFIVFFSILYKKNTLFSKFIFSLAFICIIIMIMNLFLRFISWNSFNYILGFSNTEEEKNVLFKKIYLIDDNLISLTFIEQYSNFLLNVIQNKFLSYRTNKPVLTLIFDRFPCTLFLSWFSMLIAIITGLFGAFLYTYQLNSFIKSVMVIFLVLGIAIPGYWLGPILMFFFQLI